MAKTTCILGSDLQLFVDGTSIAAATNCSISMNADATDISHKDICGFKSQMITSRSWEATTSNLYATGQGTNFAALFAAYKEGTEVTISIGTTQNAGNVDTDRVTEVPTGGWSNSGILYGKAIITSLSLSGDNTGVASYEATFTGTGPIDTTEPTSGNDSSANS